jgi:hypothetical protein
VLRICPFDCSDKALVSRVVAIIEDVDGLGCEASRGVGRSGFDTSHKIGRARDLVLRRILNSEICRSGISHSVNVLLLWVCVKVRRQQCATQRPT